MHALKKRVMCSTCSVTSTNTLVSWHIWKLYLRPYKIYNLFAHIIKHKYKIFLDWFKCVKFAQKLKKSKNSFCMKFICDKLVSYSVRAAITVLLNVLIPIRCMNFHFENIYTVKKKYIQWKNIYSENLKNIQN